MNTNHFDVIIIGTGAGGGALCAVALLLSGKRILILETRHPSASGERVVQDFESGWREARGHAPPKHQPKKERTNERA